MVEPGVMATFALASVLLVIVPGPSVLFVVSRGVTLGRRAALLTVVGNAAGIYCQVIAVAAGVGAAVERSVLVLTVLKFAGAAYLVVLGAQAIAQRRKLAGVLDATGVLHPPRRIVRDGFLVGITNPKGIVFFTAILPQFVDPGGAPAGAQMLVLGTISVLVALVCDSAWGVVAGTARSWLAASPRRLERLGGTGGLVMIGLGVRLAFTGKRD